MDKDLVAKLARARVLVVGDVMLDTYLMGLVERLSPEAPVPVVRYESETHVPGGAANAARNIASLGARVTLVGVCGKDPAGSTLRKLFAGDRLTKLRLLIDPSRPTTQKQRVVVKGYQQLARIDKESTGALAPALAAKLISEVRKALPKHGALLVSDYGKGLLSPAALTALVALAAKAKVPVVLDPKPKSPAYLRGLRGVSLITPNLGEAHVLAGKRPPAALAEALSKATGGAALITMSGEGMLLREPGQKPLRLRAKHRAVVDVSGAGDTVVAVCALALAAGMPLPQAAELANAAAGVVVLKAGTATLSAKELTEAL